jgi:hypothetical protein
VLSLVTLALLCADPAPTLVVLPFQPVTDDPRFAPLSRAVQSVLEADLRANGLAVRTEDDLDASQWGKIKGATHLVVGSVHVMAGRLLISARLVQLPNVNVASAKFSAWGERKHLLEVLFRELKHAPPALPLRLLAVDTELMLAWGAALDAVHEGAPGVAKQRVADVVAKWPAFTPARERLERL